MCFKVFVNPQASLWLCSLPVSSGNFDNVLYFQPCFLSGKQMDCDFLQQRSTLRTNNKYLVKNAECICSLPHLWTQGKITATFFLPWYSICDRCPKTVFNREFSLFTHLYYWQNRQETGTVLRHSEVSTRLIFIQQFSVLPEARHIKQISGRKFFLTVSS